MLMNAQPQRSARRSTQLDLFRAPRRKPSFTPEKIAQVAWAIWRASKPVSGTLGERCLSRPAFTYAGAGPLPLSSRLEARR